MILWENAVFHTMNKENKVYDRVLTDQGIIIAVDDEIKQYVYDQRIDLKGYHVYPGFTDHHLHLIGYGRKLSTHQLNLEKSREKVMLLLRKWYQDKMLKVEGYFNIGLTKKDLDQISTTHPILLRHYDYHSFTVNSYVLKEMGIEHETGILLEESAHDLENMWTQESKDTLFQMTKDAIKSLHAYGITSIVTEDLFYFNGYKETIEILVEAIKMYPIRTFGLM